jgi:hypothetical protein
MHLERLHSKGINDQGRNGLHLCFDFDSRGRIAHSSAGSTSSGALPSSRPGWLDRSGQGFQMTYRLLIALLAAVATISVAHFRECAMRRQVLVLNAELTGRSTFAPMVVSSALG